MQEGLTKNSARHHLAVLFSFPADRAEERRSLDVYSQCLNLFPKLNGVILNHYNECIRNFKVHKKYFPLIRPNNEDFEGYINNILDEYQVLVNESVELFDSENL